MKRISRQTRVLTVGIFLMMTGLTLVAPILPLYAREFGVSRTAAGALISVFAGARLVFDLVGGIASDRMGARRVMLWAAGLLAVSSVGAALAPTYALLLAARVLEGFGTAAFATAAMKLIIVTTPRERLGRTMAFYQTGLLAGVSLGPLVGGLSAEFGSFTTPFWMYAVLGGLVGVLVWRYVEAPEVQTTSLRAVYGATRTLLRSSPFLALMFVAITVFFMRAGARLTLLPLYAGEELGLSEARIGVVLAVGAIMTLAVVNVGGWLIDRVGRVPVLIAGLLATAATIAAHGAVTTLPGLLAVSAAFGVAAGIMGTAPPTLAGDLSTTGSEGAAVGLYRMAGDIGLVLGPLVLGSLADDGAFVEGFQSSAGLLVLAAAAAVVIGRVHSGRDAVRAEAPEVGNDPPILS
ncbi:MAG: MFS transporter [Acidimicrobiia bacterium]|nr:MFS transporter [Acidimicrobiia bacterium]